MSTNVDAKIQMGRIVGLFGVKGWVKVFSYTDPREQILQYPVWEVSESEHWRSVKVIGGKRQGKGVIALLEGTEDRDGAARWIGKEIALSRDALPATERDTFYWTDLEGLSVRRKNGELLGSVDYLLETGANDVMVVKGDVERLIPFVMHQTVLSVDLDTREILVDWDWEE